MRAEAWVVLGLVALWLGLQADALRVAMEPATGDGFTRGMARLQGVLVREVLAFGVAVAAWAAGRKLPARPLRWLSLAPAVAMAVLGLTVIVRVATALG